MGILQLLGVRRRAPAVPDLQVEARVWEGTAVNMYESDLFKFRNVNPDSIPMSYSDWKIMIGGWMNRGASVDLFFQRIHPEAQEPINTLQKNYKDKLKLFNISGMRSKGLLDVLTKFHFTTFSNPEQFWVEGNHPIDSDLIYDCEFARYISQNTETEDTYNELRKYFEDFRKHAKEI